MKKSCPVCKRIHPTAQEAAGCLYKFYIQKGEPREFALRAVKLGTGIDLSTATW